ncbi:MAG: ribokinase [Lachnospiraceae bacterium]|nr:ribokinase [Lachnospiraceae bacterium]
MKILNFGSLNLDYTYSVDHIVKEGETISSLGVQTNLGGKGFNQSVALARAGKEVFHAGLVGEGGQLFFEACNKYGINTKYMNTVLGRSGHTIIQVDKNGQNSIVLYGGANQKITKDYVNKVLNDFSKGDIIILQNEINELPYIIDEAFKREMTIVLNPSPMDEKINACNLKKVSIFILNETEGQQLTLATDANGILDAMQRRFPASRIMLTLGKDGCIFRSGRKTVSQKAFSVDAVDTTAAGDTFTGFFIAGLVDELPIKDVLCTATKASALAVQKEGAAQSIPTMEEVERFRP